MRGLKSGGCRMETKEYTGHRWCSVQANYWSCFLEFKSFVMTKEQACGPGNRLRGKRLCTRWKWVWEQPSVEEMLQWSLQWSWCLKALGQKRHFHLTQEKSAPLVPQRDVEYSSGRWRGRKRMKIFVIVRSRLTAKECSHLPCLSWLLLGRLLSPRVFQIMYTAQ